MSFKPYPKYKESGVEWLGRVPEHWRTMQLRFLLLEGKDGIRIGPFGSSIKIEHLVPEGTKVYGQENVIYRDFEAGDRRITESHYQELAEYEIRVGDVLVTMAGTAGRCQAVPDQAEKGIIDSHLVRMRFPAGDVYPPFIPHLIESAAYVVAQIQVAWRGTTMQGLNSTIIKHLLVAIPGVEEQRAIATFLDHETAKIDALIAEQQRLIELLQEKRQAVISHAVTKGLNPDAPMKDSRIEWLGEVPEHWKVGRGRFLYSQVEIPPEPDDGVVTAFRDGQVTLRSNRRTEGFTFAVLEVGYQRVREGDLVIHGMDAFAGAIGVSESTGKCTPEYAVLEPFQQGICNAYFAKVLRLMAHRNFIYVICPSVRERAPRFRFESFKDVLLPVPPEAEQHAIVQHVASQEQAMASLAVEAGLTIALLQERRSALISAAVTGQIDVRDFAPGGGSEAA